MRTRLPSAAWAIEISELQTTALTAVLLYNRDNELRIHMPVPFHGCNVFQNQSLTYRGMLGLATYIV